MSIRGDVLSPAPQIWWFSSDTARCINSLTYLLTEEAHMLLVTPRDMMAQS